MATILLTLPEGESVTNGKLITFMAPCACTSASSITIESQAYTLVDALGNNLSTKNAFSQGTSVTVAINTTDKKAVLQSSGIAASADSINTTVPVDKGGTGATSAEYARSNLGLTVVYDAMELYDESKGTIEQRLAALEAIQQYDGTINIS